MIATCACYREYAVNKRYYVHAYTYSHLNLSACAVKVLIARQIKCEP